MSATSLTITQYASPIGPLTVVTSPKGLCRLAFASEKLEISISYLTKKIPGAVFETKRNSSSCREVLLQLEEYFAGRRCKFNLDLDCHGTSFQKSVWSALQKIPYGTTCSYSNIARVIGKPRACRAVGQAIHQNPVGIIIPCHRVIGKNGKLVGFAGGLSIKKWLLDFEKQVTLKQTTTGR